jgi:hypothetical protein
LVCLQIAKQYCLCAKLLPSISNEMFCSLCKMLKLFNSKSALLILGAEVWVLGRRKISILNFKFFSAKQNKNILKATKGSAGLKAKQKTKKKK